MGFVREMVSNQSPDGNATSIGGVPVALSSPVAGQGLRFFDDSGTLKIRNETAEASSGDGGPLAVATDLYVDVATGNDTTGDGSSGNKFASVKKALAVAATYYGNFVITISVTAGTYPDNIDAVSYSLRTHVKAIGGTVIFSGTTFALQAGIWRFEGCEFRQEVYCNGGYLRLVNPTFNNVGGSYGLTAQYCSTVEILVTTYIVKANPSIALFRVKMGSVLTTWGSTMSLQATLSCTYGVFWANAGGLCWAGGVSHSVSYNGYAISCRKGYADLGGRVVEVVSALPTGSTPYADSISAYN